MLSPRLTNCPECANIPSLLKKIDCKLAELGNNLYNNVSYMLNKPVPANDILQLIGYRRILTHKYCNPNYVHEYSVAMIASRVIRLTLGCVSKCNEPERCLEEPCDIKIVPNPTTTSTSTLPTTTTTSTSSTSSTTTTSTTAVPTTTTTSSSSSTSTTTSTTTICQDCIAHDVTIGTQVWTGCNLDVTTYRNGDPIPEVTDQGAWNSLTTGAWCYYENTSSNGTTYGKLYNWHAVNDPRGLAPNGYHIPSDEEWTTLVNYLGGDNVAGGHLKEPGFCHWEIPNADADNSSDFTGLPSGIRGLLSINAFTGITLLTYFWTSTPYLGGADGYAYQLRYVDGIVVRGFFTVRNGFAVRLIKDTEPTTTTTTSSSSTTTTTTTLAPINPDDIAGLWAWYKGDAGVIGGAQVTTWEDQSILGNDLLTELTAYPEAVTDTVGTLSTTVVRKVNFATLANMATVANFPNINSTGGTMFVVCKVITSPDILQYVVKAPNMELYTNTTPAMNSVIGGGATLTQTVAYNQYYTFRNGTDLINEYFSVNNTTTLTSPDAAGFYLARKFRIFAQNGPGTSPSEQGDVAFAEIIVYNTSLTPTEILGVETYLRNKYNHY